VVYEKERAMLLSRFHFLFTFFCADGMNLLGDNIRVDTIKKDTDTLIGASKEVGLEVAVSSPECRAKL
jgi:hypothetical protein